MVFRTAALDAARLGRAFANRVRSWPANDLYRGVRKMAVRKAKIEIWGIAGSLGLLGAYAQLWNWPLWDGHAWGRDPQGDKECQADLEWFSTGGFGLSYHRLGGSANFDCADVDCAFKNGDEVTLTVVTLLFFTIHKVECAFCTTVSAGWQASFGVGLGYQGAVWKIRNTRPW
jgi:hypothetical protein